jgi:hypothetical protein
MFEQKYFQQWHPFPMLCNNDATIGQAAGETATYRNGRSGGLSLDTPKRDEHLIIGVNASQLEMTSLRPF